MPLVATRITVVTVLIVATLLPQNDRCMYMAISYDRIRSLPPGEERREKKLKAEFSNDPWDEAPVKKVGRKTRIGIRIDTEVLDFFKKDGPGWQARMNDFLRTALK